MINKCKKVERITKSALVNCGAKQASNIKNNKEKKKILHLVEAMGGGVFTYIVDLANELSDEYDIYIAYAIRKETPENFRDYFNKGIRLIEVKNFDRSINLIKDFKAFFEIRKIAKSVNPDIIHLHSSKAGALGRCAFYGWKVQLFYTPHGYSFLMEDCGRLKKTIYKALEMILSKRRCTIISCSYGEHKETLKLTSNAKHVNNGININKLQHLIGPQKKNNTEHKLTVFTLGRICYQKNPDKFNSIAKEFPNINFLWIGDGELRDRLTSPNIKITGWVNRELALQYSMQADVFMLTSLWEGLPISLLESMYMKKICIVSDVIGNKDVIHNEINGYICNSTNEFVKALNYVQNNLNKVIIENSYNDVINEYNTFVMARKYKLIYEESNI